MKKIALLTTIITLGLNLSCSDRLEEEIVSGITADTHYTEVGGWEDGVKAAYAPLRDWYAREEGMTLTVFGTDIFTKGADGNFKSVNDYDAGLNATVDILRNMWNSFYEGINTINTVVSYAEQGLVEGLDEELADTRIAEMRFLRAFYYYHLAETWGDVHFTLEATTEVETEANQTPVAEIYAQGIIPDLEYAITELPDKQSDYGRISKPVAEAILARVQLTRGNYAEAERLAKTVINDYDFELLEDWGDIWNIDNELNSEVIWSVQYTSDPFTNGGGSRGHLYFLAEYDKIPGMQRDINNGRPWKRFQPTSFFLDLYNRDIDSRYAEGFKEVWYANSEENLPEGVALGDTAFYVVPYAVPDDVQASKPYFWVDVDPNSTDEVMSLRQVNKRWFPSLNKYIDPNRITVQQTEGSRDFIVTRLAEMYLIAAEALLMQGNTEEAVPFVNAIRRRAAFPGEEEAMEIAADELDLDFVLDERARELAGEQLRWFDLKRTGTLVERVRAYNPDGGPNIQEYHTVRPIPQDQLDRTTNEYPQNEGY